MPLTATFLADFSSFLDASTAAITKTEELTTAAGAVGPAIDASMKNAGAATADAAAAAAEAEANAIELGRKIGAGLKDVAGKVTDFVSGYVSEYMEAEEATSRLNAAILASGNAAPGVAEGYAQIATELSKLSGFADDALTNAETLLTTIGHVQPDAMRETLAAATELARGLNIDLIPAAKMVATAAASDGENLGKLKKILGDAVPEGAKFADVMEAINEKFGGQNAAHMQTTAGHMETIKNQMSEINEQVGQVFAENLKTIMDLFQKLPEGLQTFIISIVAIGTALAPVLVSLSSLISILSTAGIGAGIIAAFKLILPYIGPAGWIALGLFALFEVWKHWDDIVELVKRVVGAIALWLGDKLVAVLQFVLSIPARIVDAFKWMYNQLVGFSIVPDLVDGIAGQFSRLQGVMVDPALAAIGDVSAGFADLADQSVGLPTLTGAAAASATSGAGGGTSITVNMSGMMGTDDPQTRAALRDVISSALMDGMRGARLMGTA